MLEQSCSDTGPSGTLGASVGRLSATAIGGGHGPDASWTSHFGPFDGRRRAGPAEGDYPPTIHPWLVLAARGVTVRKVRPRSFLIAGVCRNVGAHLVLNGTQGVGAIPINVTSGGASAISSSGFKWLCGPYATGFAWIRDDLLADMRPFQSYWLAGPAGSSLDLNLAAEPVLAEDIGARAFDVFGTANFFNFMPWAAALDLLLSVGIGMIAEHNKRLVGHLHTALDPAAYDWISPDAKRGSAIVALSRRDPEANRRTVSHLSTKGIDVALRGSRVRISQHIYNDIADIDALVIGLHEASVRG